MLEVLLFEAAGHKFRVPYDGSFQIERAATEPPEDSSDIKQNKRRLRRLRKQLGELQHKLYADDRYAVLAVFQAMDAAGKDGTIRAVMTGINPAGVQVHSFKQPSAEELDHDFLWRTYTRLPERGRIGVCNRSYYEEVLVVRVHPQILGKQRLPDVDLKRIWRSRFASIRDKEEHLARNGVIVLKFWLNVSLDQQRRRFLRRLDDPERHWKFSIGDVEERQHWNAYMQAYEEALSATSRPWAPWYAIPADDKPYMRAKVAEILVENLRRLNLRYPPVDEKVRARFDEMRELLDRDPSAHP